MLFFSHPCIYLSGKTSGDNVYNIGRISLLSFPSQIKLCYCLCLVFLEVARAYNNTIHSKDENEIQIYYCFCVTIHVVI